jgi:hypothetical protein
MGCRIARCRFGCWARLEVCETLPGRPLCHRCWERHERREEARRAGAAALKELAEARKARIHAMARARLAGTVFENQPNDWDRF